MDVRFKILPEKTDEKGYAPIFIRSYLNGEEFKYFTGEKCMAKYWKAESREVLKGQNGYKEINQRLQKLKQDIELILHDCKMKSVTPTVSLIKERIKTKATAHSQQKSIIELLDEFLYWSSKHGKKLGTLKNLKTSRNHIAEFSKKVKVDVESFSKENYDQYINFLMSIQEYHPNYIGSQTKNLKTFFNWCKSEKGIKLSENHPKLSVTKIEQEKIYLNSDELQKIKEIELKEHLDKVRDCFMFACYTGLRYSDLKRVTKEMIIQKNGFKVISITPEKTNSFYNNTRKKLEIALIPDAIRIIEKYQDGYRNSMPVISNQKMNEYLKEIGKLAEINEIVETFTYKNGKAISNLQEKWTLITCHTARHTFATQALNRGVRMEVVQELLGHSNIKTTMVYAKLIEDYKHQQLLKAFEQ